MGLLLNVNGGMGKHVIFSALLPNLKKKYNEVHVMNHYVDTTLGYEGINVIDYSNYSPSLYKELVLRDDIKIIWRDPYDNSLFIKKKVHLLEAWSEELEIEYTKLEDYKPQIDLARLSPNIKTDVEKVIKEIDGDFTIIQLTGGMSPLDNSNSPYPYATKPEPLKRNYPFPKQLVSRLREKFPKLKIINFSLGNEPTYEGTIKLNLPYIYYAELLKYSKGFISIDSSLQHLASSVDREGVVIWGESRPEHFGWTIHKNLSIPLSENASPYFRPLGHSTNSIEFPEPITIIEKFGEVLEQKEEKKEEKKEEQKDKEE